MSLEEGRWGEEWEADPGKRYRDWIRVINHFAENDLQFGSLHVRRQLFKMMGTQLWLIPVMGKGNGRGLNFEHFLFRESWGFFHWEIWGIFMGNQIISTVDWRWQGKHLESFPFLKTGKLCLQIMTSRIIQTFPQTKRDKILFWNKTDDISESYLYLYYLYYRSHNFPWIKY